jgi:hypothetical protein
MFSAGFIIPLDGLLEKKLTTHWEVITSRVTVPSNRGMGGWVVPYAIYLDQEMDVKKPLNSKTSRLQTILKLMPSTRDCEENCPPIQENKGDFI